MKGVIIGAPTSGAGKTTVTLALLRLLARDGTKVRGAKSGPDYIDPRFHEAACGAPCPNLDGWAMNDRRLADLATGDGPLIIEGAMGLFDGAPPNGRGSSADLARRLGLPVILVVDAARMSQSIAPLVAGFARYDRQVTIGAVILNNVGSARHEAMLRYALDPLGIPILAVLRRDRALAQPSRHLGLVQAGEHTDLADFLDTAADFLESSLDRALLERLFSPLPPLLSPPLPPSLPSSLPGPSVHMDPPAQVISIARDLAFSFIYPHLLTDWRARGAQIQFFSPLADEPVPDAGFIFLPGGYPELHAGRIATANTFKNSIRKAAQTSVIYGECGGYMALGETLIDADGRRHEMVGLLGLETSFEERKLHLGYRQLSPLTPNNEGVKNNFLGQDFLGHEFHYATTLRAQGPALFKARDAQGDDLGDMGLINGAVSGSFAHIIDKAASD